MLHDLTRWLLYSPTRLLAVAVVVLGVGAIAWTGVAPKAQPPHAAPPKQALPSAALSTPGPTTSTHVGERTGTSRPVMRAARKFLAEYVVPPGARTPETAPNGLEALTTPALWKGLRLTHPDTLPRGPVLSIDLEAAGPYSGTVLAELDDGPDLTLSVVAWQRGWRIGDVRPTEDS